MAAGLMSKRLGSSRDYHFFDSFEGLPPAKEIDGVCPTMATRRSVSMYFNNCTASEQEFCATIAKANLPSERLHIHRGFFEETVPKSNTGPIGLLRLDGDWYESTICCLRSLFPRIVPGGILIIDDYGTWDGCTRALHDYLSRTISTGTRSSVSALVECPL